MEQVTYKLQPGETTQQVIEIDGWWERVRFAFHFFKVGFSFLKPWKPNPVRVTSTITRGKNERASGLAQ